ncbi:MFS transporter [Vogesella fluminis]|uniref:MFS transporter n=2 Tax=Vogesella fluminis TaxID=1069161 RepID=A0ABQ3H659_9NEIS|nr:MFS transporter [Vogesella fluminis]
MSAGDRSPALAVMNDGTQHGARQTMFGFLHLALIAPSTYLVLGLPLVLRQHGWSGTEIGLFQLAGLPAVFKFMLAVPVERMRWAAGHYKIWAIGVCLAYAALLLTIGQQDLAAGGGRLFLIALGAGLMATWADIPVNALAIKVLPPSERMRAGGFRSAAIFLGAIIGGGLMLLVHERWGWQAPFVAMTIPVLIGIGLLVVFKEPATEPSAASTQGITGQTALLAGYFRQPGANAWTLLLLSYFPLVGAAWIYLKPLLLDHGFAANQVAWVAGVLGSTAGALASIGAARLIKAIGVAHALALFAGLNILALGGLTLLACIEAGQIAFAAGVMVLACTMGATSALAFGLMMGFTRPQYQAADYGTQASLFTLSRLLMLPLAGVILDRFGYAGMLSSLTLAMLGVFVLAMRQRHRIDRVVRGCQASHANAFAECKNNGC